MSDYFSTIKVREKNRLHAIQLENNLKDLRNIKQIVLANTSKIEVFQGINKQIQSELQRDYSISDLKRKLYNLTIIHELEAVLSELGNIKDFPTSQTENEVKKQIKYCYETMKLEDIPTSVKQCISINNYVHSERARIKQEIIARIYMEEQKRLQREREERERNIKIAKYIGIAIAIGFGIWLLITYVIPFLVEWGVAILVTIILILILAYFSRD